mmetsp:Transcript_24736/g.33944  ORF Transcript_24736/g.33944 Transcript_24736/m.33944 type:complete len:218 (-) Transcript_24736:595-1248(-)
MPTATLPSQKASRDTSGPARRCSTTTSRPAPPSWPSSSMARTVCTASSLLAGSTTPLPAARPDALTTSSCGADRMYSSASAQSVKDRCSAVGRPWRAMNSLDHALEPSSCAARAEGPKHKMCSCRSMSASPSTRGCSGPTTTSDTCCSRAKHTMPAKSSAAMDTFPHCAAPGVFSHSFPSRWVPKLPGHTEILRTKGLFSRLTVMACSRPPPPTTIT